MADLDLLKNTVFIFLSDHGEGFMEKGSFDHTFLSLYQSDIETPLIITGPGIPKGKTIEYPVQNIDIFPWLIEYLQLDESIQMDGMSLFSPERKNHPAISENFTFHNFLVDSDHLYFSSNRARLWPGTIRPFRSDRSLENSLQMEFGSDRVSLPIPEESKLNLNFGFTDLEIMFCKSSEKDRACFLMLEYQGFPDELKGDMEAMIQYDHRCLSDVENGSLDQQSDSFTSGKCTFYIRESVAIPCSLNERSIRLMNWKLIHDLGDNSSELYNLEVDPGETTDVVDAHPEMAELLLKRVNQAFRNDDYTGGTLNLDELDQDTRNALHALGYIQGSD